MDRQCCKSEASETACGGQQQLGAAPCWHLEVGRGAFQTLLHSLSLAPWDPKARKLLCAPKSSNLASDPQTRASKGFCFALGEIGSWLRLILLASRLSVCSNHYYKSASAEHLVKYFLSLQQHLLSRQSNYERRANSWNVCHPQGLPNSRSGDGKTGEEVDGIGSFLLTWPEN